MSYARDTSTLIPIMTSNTAPSGVASASAGSYPYKAFNAPAGDSPWDTVAGSPTGWLAYEFPSAVAVNSYSLYPNGEASMPNSWTFEGWNGSSWVVLDTKSGVTWTGEYWGNGTKRYYSFSNSTAYTKYRINISANNGASFVAIEAMEMFSGGATDLEQAMTGGM